MDSSLSGVETGARTEDDGRCACFGKADCDGAANTSACTADEDSSAGEVLFGRINGRVGVVVDSFGDSKVAFKLSELYPKVHCIDQNYIPGPSMGFGVPCGGGMVGQFQYSFLVFRAK